MSLDKPVHAPFGRRQPLAERLPALAVAENAPKEKPHQRILRRLRRVVLVGVPALVLIGLAVWGLALFLQPHVLVIDEVDLLDRTARQRIERAHAALAGDYGIDYRVVTTEQAVDIDALAVALYRSLEVGATDGRGLLLLVDPAHDRVRLEVGYALEGAFPDGFVGQVEREQMVPFFQRGRVADGILATTELIVTRAEAAVQAGLMGDAGAGTGGGGAVTRAAIDAGVEPVPQPSRDLPDVAAGDAPTETVDAYIDTMGRYDARADLDIYTSDTRRMLRGWAMTRAQMRNVATSHAQCTGALTRIDGDLAVVRYDAAAAACNPYFLRRADGRWRLDFAVMQKLVRFDHRNHWSMPWGAGEYAFAFDN